MATKETESPKNTSRRPLPPGTASAVAAAAAAKEGFLSPRFRSAAAMAGWDEEALLLATLVVEDTPVRESRHKKRQASGSHQLKSPPSTNSNTRKRRSRRRSPDLIPAIVLSLDDDEKADAKDANKEMKEEEKVVSAAEEKVSKVGASDLAEKVATSSAVPCMDRLREELSCAICLEICFEPSTTACGHSFCMKCLKHAAAKCGKRCPKCRQLISNARSCTVNTVLWNTIQLLFPNEVETRRCSIAAASSSNEDGNQSPPRSNSVSQGSTRSSNTGRSFITQGSTRNSNTRRSFITHGSTRSGNSGRSFVQASQLVTTRRAVGSGQSEDAALAYRLQQEEFMSAFESDNERPRSTIYTARANLRAMASRAIRLRSRGWPV